MKHTIDESSRLGLSFRMQNCLGFSTNGGPWIKPDEAMQKLVWTDTIITINDNRTIDIELQQPEIHKPSNYYRDISVLAVKLNSSNVIPLSDIYDITDLVDNGKVLGWSADAGQWKIVRYGYTPTGVMPHPVDKYVNGLECDKMNRDAIVTHFTNYIQKVLDINGSNINKTINAVILDSYEAGGQTWTSRFREMFISKRGYDPLFWLPTLGMGDIRKHGNSSLDWIPPIGELLVENQDLTERFRYDFYNTIEDLVIEENIAALTQLTHQYPNVKFELQPYNAPYNFIRGGRRADTVSGEFWHNNSAYGWWTLSLAASVANITNTPIVHAEAFTASPSNGNWDVLPEDLKAEADSAFSLGVNSFQIHVMPHQPWDNSVKPGMISQSWGTQLNRHNSWWDKSGAWNLYLTRVQSMLRQGCEVSDIAYVYPSFQRGITDEDGYNSDAMDEEFIIKHVDADEEGIVLDNGRRYKLLVLTDKDAMSLDLMKKIALLVEKGACIMGIRPIKSPSLSGYPENDKVISDLSAKMWGDCDGVNTKKHQYGKGFVYCGMTIADVLKDINVNKDVEVLQGKENIVWTHRRSEDADIYFIANQSKKPINTVINFRVNGKIPELWDAEKGTISESNNWKMNDNNTEVSINLESLQSYFVVFRQNATYFKNNIINSKTKFIKSEIVGPWNVTFNSSVDDQGFEIEMDTLHDGSQSSERKIKYFSGTATYSKCINLTQKEIKKSKTVYLDLDKVGGIASLKVNGQDVGIMWKHPYKVNITQYVKSGSNLLEIEVSNTLANCLIGDEQWPSDTNRSKQKNLIEYPEWFYTGSKRQSERKTFTTYNYYNKDSKLLPSGVLDKIYIIRNL